MAHLGTYELADQLFPDRIRRHRLEYPDTEVLEHVAARLAQAEFPQAALLRFLRQVCRWGGYYGIAARVRNSNEPEAIRQAFVGARDQLGEGNVVEALGQVNALNGLGRPAFASKFLRFMAPQSAAILDRIISQHTGFPLSAVGYGQLNTACHNAAAQLANAGVHNPFRQDGVWFIADIEAAFYADMENLET
ncbi:hypothetical protein ACFSQQ_09605 [Mesorhizobium kowhaii]|uniref:hypothetical protein n=1 Tax=Mesorhizobium kowhaii TaxID=1300272 RepID=UPI0035EE6B7E